MHFNRFLCKPILGQDTWQKAGARKGSEPRNKGGLRSLKFFGESGGTRQLTGT
jgi:hypothetical protein